MQDNLSNNRTIAKNTMYMYLRMAITMIANIYISRVVLNVLGVEDYGLYNVIGGIIALFTVLNSAMINTTSRFITVYLAKGDERATRGVFNMTALIHVAIAVIILVLGETIGLWYLHNKLVIPEGREFAAEWLYQLSVITTLMSIVTVPYNAAIVAHERMGVYAYLQIFDVSLRLIIVLSIKYVPFDKLIYYATLLAILSIVDLLIYILYCKKKFPETKMMYYWDKSLFKQMTSFIGWALVGNFSNMFYTQGINLMLNAFCGPAVNAARGVAVQVENVVRQFAANVQTAINPQILKSYAVKEMDRMYALIIASSRYCFYLLFFLSLPILIETDFILTLWLGNVPDHTVNFVRIILITVLLDAFVNPMFTANLASGKLAIYHGSLAVLMYSFMLITYFTIKSTRVPESVFLCYLIASIIGYIMKIFILYYQVGLKPRIYVRRALLPVIEVVVISILAPLLVHHFLNGGWSSFLITSTVAALSVASVVYFIGITKEERVFALNFAKNKIHNFKINKLKNYNNESYS